MTPEPTERPPVPDPGPEVRPSDELDAPHRRRFLRLLLGCLAAGWIIALDIAGGSQGWGDIAETSALEHPQTWLWAACAGLAFSAIAKGPTFRDRMNAFWLWALATLAALRELDLHVQLNPETHGWGFGVSYKLEWWLDAGSAPLIVKLVWACIGVGAIAALLVPPLIVRAPVLHLLRRRDPATLLFIASIALLGAGYVMDDVLGRGQFLSPALAVGIEESAELLGVLAFLASLVLTHRKPLSARLSPAIWRGHRDEPARPTPGAAE